MPDQDCKKNQHRKGKSDPKEQRKPRQQRNQATSQSKSEKRTEEPKVTVPEKPAFEEPGPEFYKGLKRETDDILKITEETNSKYKKKEIQSNWAKYEVPIESYDDIEEQENLGADYEQLIKAPLSLGGHFQFKHEKSWDITTGPSLYDKYFDINMNDLATALCTIPFYERNDIDKSIFTETDIQTMDQRTSRYKHKYFKIATTESELQDKLINLLKDDCKPDETVKDVRESECELNKSYENEIDFELSNSTNTEGAPQEPSCVEIVFNSATAELNAALPAVEDNRKPKPSSDIDSRDDIIGGTIRTNEILNIKPELVKTSPIPETKVAKKDAAATTESKKNPVLESPEDLEKWLDDFLEE